MQSRSTRKPGRSLNNPPEILLFLPCSIDFYRPIITGQRRCEELCSSICLPKRYGKDLGKRQIFGGEPAEKAAREAEKEYMSSCKENNWEFTQCLAINSMRIVLCRERTCHGSASSHASCDQPKIQTHVLSASR